MFMLVLPIVFVTFCTDDKVYYLFHYLNVALSTKQHYVLFIVLQFMCIPMGKIINNVHMSPRPNGHV